MQAAATPADAVYPELVSASINWWNDDKDEAIALLTKIADQAPSESELRLDLAELLEQQGERSEALALADQVQPLDNSTMKRCEEIARLAVMIGDLNRARMAAERLFGLRLDTETQMRLAGQMGQLGQHELAEAVLGQRPGQGRQQGDGDCGPHGPVPEPGQARYRRANRHADPAPTTAVRQTNPNYYIQDNPDAEPAPWRSASWH